MQTDFPPELLSRPDFAASERAVRTCVHCGFCTATCPTYVLLGDELDSPRGRIMLMKDMLEANRPADAETVKHVDRCLSCLACMTTCPSGVNYMHLVDHARAHIARTYRRPWPDHAVRALLGVVLPRPGLFRAGLHAAVLARPLAHLFPRRLRPMLQMAPAHVPPASRDDRPQVFPAAGVRRARVALLTGCAQKVLSPTINEATIRLLRRLGCEVVVAEGAGCCGALTHHLGQDGRAYARRNIAAWLAERDRDGLDAVVVNTSGCGTTIKDWGHLFADEPALAAGARTIASLARDVTEWVAALGLGPVAAPNGARVAYHAACSLQHGQQIRREPKALLAAAGYTVVDVPEAHLCCGSAGTYNLLQPEIARQLRDRKVANIARTDPEIVAAGNVGCITQIAKGTMIPVVHTVELLDWATGGPKPVALGCTPIGSDRPDQRAEV